jgi:hypothetical protein
VIKATIVFDNSWASGLTPDQFVDKYYLTLQGMQDVKYLKVEQDATFEELGEKK